MKTSSAFSLLMGLFFAGWVQAQEAGVTTGTQAAAGAPLAPGAVEPSASGDTNIAAAADSKAPEDPVKNMILRFSFDTGLAPESPSAEGGAPMVFQRESPAYVNGQDVAPQVPRLAAGKFGKGLLLESAHANLCSAGQASMEDAALFQALNGSALAGTSDKPFEGKQALAVTTKGEAAEEGVALEFKVEKAFYTGASIVPACYVASLYLKGQGGLKISLKDLDSDKAGEAVYVDLDNEWKRFCCTFSYPFPARGIGAKREADWKTLLPPGTNIETRLHLAIVTTDNSKMTFFADALQLEKRETTYTGTGVGVAPHAWVPGGMALADETLKMETKHDAFGRWRTNGTVSFWFHPNWDVRDGTRDTIMQVAPNLMSLQHLNGKLHLAPAGTAFVPSDWQNIWHHIAITWNKEGRWILYIDALDYPNDEMMNRPMAAATGVTFGSANLSAAPNGMIDDLIFFQIPLTPEQVKALVDGNLLKPGETAASAEMPAADAIPSRVNTTNGPAAAAAPASSEPVKPAGLLPETKPESEPAAPAPPPAAGSTAALSNAPVSGSASNTP